MSDFDDFYIQIYVFKGAEANGTGLDCVNTIFTKLPRVKSYYLDQFSQFKVIVTNAQISLNFPEMMVAMSKTL